MRRRRCRVSSLCDFGEDEEKIEVEWAGQWLMLGCLTDFLVNMSASADVLALAKVEVDLATIPEGKNVSSMRSRLDYEAYSVNRSSSNGEASPCSFATARKKRFKKLRRSTGTNSETHSLIRIVSRNQSG